MAIRLVCPSDDASNFLPAVQDAAAHLEAFKSRVKVTEAAVAKVGLCISKSPDIGNICDSVRDGPLLKTIVDFEDDLAEHYKTLGSLFGDMSRRLEESADKAARPVLQDLAALKAYICHPYNHS